MTTQDIIKKTESFTKEQKQELAYYLLFSTISDDKKQEIMHLFHYKNDIETNSPNEKQKTNTNAGISNLLKYSGILEGVDTSDISDDELHLQED